MTAAPKERPILFSSPMVRALLAGTKTQTRRLIKPQPFIDRMGNVAVELKPGSVTLYGQHPDGSPQWENFARWRCPYGIPGDRLWVRESWCAADTPSGYAFMADAPGDARGLGWRPSIHMPRRASRLTLTVTDVRVQRLCDISGNAAEAEGLKWIAPGVWSVDAVNIPVAHADPRIAYLQLWDHINGVGAAALNPWVWAVSFEVANR